MIIKGRYSEKSGRIVFNVVLLFIAVILFRFHQMMILCGDNTAHLNLAKILFQENEEQLSYGQAAMSYPLYHISAKLIAIILGGRYETAGAAVLTASGICTILITRYLLERFVKPSTVFGRWMTGFISIGSVFFGTLKGPLTGGRYYAGQCAANPWHNPTIIFVRPFGLVTFCIFIDLFIKMKEGGQDCRKKLIAFSIASALSTFAKPSYTIVLLPAAGVCVFLYWMRDFKGNFIFAVRMLAAVVPTILILLFQFLYDTQKAGISVGIVWGSFAGFTSAEVVCVSLATFTVPVAAFFVCSCKKMMSDDYLRLAYLTLLFGWLEMFLLSDGGSGNFSWGYDLAVGLSTVMAVGYVLKNYYRKWQMYFVTVIFFMQTVSGVHYFYLIRQMDGYYWF